VATVLIIAILLGSLVDAGPSTVPAYLVPRENADVTAIRGVLAGQVAAWNRGDIDGFMRGYEQAETTTLIQGGTVTRGWKSLLDYYKRTYTTREKMGTLAFSDLSIRRAPGQYNVTGKWQLTRASETSRGSIMMVFRHTSAGWRIVHDHTTPAS
jgi:ketosteroid isomerase-like protein